MLVERKPVAINTIDFTSYFADTGYEVEYIKRTGGNGGMMQDGSITEDVLDIKAVVTLPRVPLNEDQLSTLLTQVMSTDYPILSYYDPRTKAERTVWTVVTLPRSKYRGYGADSNSYWTGPELVFTEK